MPRNKFLAQIYDELVQAKSALAFWRDQALLFPDEQLQACAKAQIDAYETLVKHLVAVQEHLHSLRDN